MTDASLGDLAAAAGALFTAIAAGAALLTARQGREILEAAERPLLEAEVLADADRDRMLRLSIINTGRGVARSSNFFVHALGEATENVIGDGFMQPGERVHVLTNIGPLPTPEGRMRHDVDDLAVLLAYRDAQGFVHYRTHAGAHYVPRTLIRRRPKYPERSKVFRRFYPHLNIDGSRRVKHNLQRIE